MKIFCTFPTVNISKLNFWLVICIAKNFIWTTLKAIFSIFAYFWTLRFSNCYISAKYCAIPTNPIINGKLIYSAFRWCIHLSLKNVPLWLVLCCRVTYVVVLPLLFPLSLSSSRPLDGRPSCPLSFHPHMYRSPPAKHSFKRTLCRLARANTWLNLIMRVSGKSLPLIEAECQFPADTALIGTPHSASSTWGSSCDVSAPWPSWPWLTKQHISLKHSSVPFYTKYYSYYKASKIQDFIRHVHNYTEYNKKGRTKYKYFTI